MRVAVVGEAGEEETERAGEVMAGHTPGPWHMCDGNRHIISDSNHMKVAEAAQIISANLRTMKTEYVPGHKMQEANARLIAAAPDLLEALIQIVDWATDPAITEWLNRSGVLGNYGLAVIDARAAIAKATEQPPVPSA